MLFQAVDCDLFFLPNVSCLPYHHRDVTEIEQKLNKNFSNVSDWFADNKLSFPLRKNMTNVILFGIKTEAK